MEWASRSFVRFRVDLGMLKVTLAFAQSIFQLFTEQIAERMAFDPRDYLFVSLIYVHTIFLDGEEIFETATIT